MEERIIALERDVNIIQMALVLVYEILIDLVSDELSYNNKLALQSQVAGLKGKLAGG